LVPLKNKRGLPVTLGRKAVSLWLSWVILVGFVVATSGFLLGWMQEYSEKSVGEMRERLYNSEVCDSVSMSIDKAFCRNPQLLNIVITNRNKFRINQIILRTYDEDRTIEVFYLNETIKPTMTDDIDVPIPVNRTISTFEAIPVYITEESEHICENKKLNVMKVTGNC